MKNRGTIKLIDLRRVKLNEFLFFAAFIFYFAHYFINASLIDNLVPGVLRLFRLAVLFILALKWLFAASDVYKRQVIRSGWRKVQSNIAQHVPDPVRPGNRISENCESVVSKYSGLVYIDCVVMFSWNSA